MTRLTPVLLLLACACGTMSNSSTPADNQSRESATPSDECAEFYDECVEHITAQGSPAELCDEIQLACSEGGDTWADSSDFVAPSEAECLNLYGECQQAAAQYGEDLSQCDEFLDFCLTGDAGGPFPDGEHGDCPDDDEWGTPSEEECLQLHADCQDAAIEYGEDPAQCDEFLDVCLTAGTGTDDGDDGWGGEGTDDGDWGAPTEEECVLIHSDCLDSGAPAQECDEFLEWCEDIASGGNSQPGL